MGPARDDGRAALTGPDPAGSGTAAPDDSSAGLIRKRSLTIAGHATSVSLEGAFWQALAALAAAEDVPVARLVERIDAARAPGANLSSAIRVHVLQRLREAARAR